MITVTQQESHGTTGRDEAIPGVLCLWIQSGWEKNPIHGGTARQCEQLLSLNLVAIKKLVAESSRQTGGIDTANYRCSWQIKSCRKFSLKLIPLLANRDLPGMRKQSYWLTEEHAVSK